MPDDRFLEPTPDDWEPPSLAEYYKPVPLDVKPYQPVLTPIDIPPYKPLRITLRTFPTGPRGPGDPWMIWPN